MVDAMDREVRAALSATRELHAELGNREREPDEFKHLRRLAVRANKAVATMHRLARAEAQRAATHETLLRETITAEGIDREANAARLQDRLRTTVYRLVDNDSSPFDRAHGGGDRRPGHRRAVPTRARRRLWHRAHRRDAAGQGSGALGRGVGVQG